MSSRATIAAGLVAGVATAVALLIAVVVLIPEPAASVATRSPEPSTSSSATSAASGSANGSASPAAVASVAEPRSRVGEQAPPLVVPQLGGGTIDLTNLRGRAVWIDFMQATCEPCRTELAAMSGFASRYADAGLVVVAIGVGEDQSTIAAFAESLNLHFPIGVDADGAAQRAWEVAAVPVHFWIDRDGVVRARRAGPLTPAAMAEQLSTILPGVRVTPS